jgi:cAMP-dependent protein kinase regulator
VFGESGDDIDRNWTPPVVEKAEAEAAECMALVRRHVLFAGTVADEKDLRTIVAAMSRRSVHAGEVVIRQGEPGDYFYLISSGQGVVLVDGAEVLQLGPGNGFGELALLYNAPRAATVQAETDMELWGLDRKTFRSVLITSVRQKREKYLAYLSSVELFSTLSDDERSRICDILEPLAVDAGVDVVREGDVDADRFYLVESGELMATQRDAPGEEVCPRLVPGSYFGELALMGLGRPRAATVTAVVPSTLLSMDKSSFLRLLQPLQATRPRRAPLSRTYVADRVDRAELAQPSIPDDEVVA